MSVANGNLPPPASIPAWLPLVAAPWLPGWTPSFPLVYPFYRRISMSADYRWTFPFSVVPAEETSVTSEKVVSPAPHELVPVVRPALLPASARYHEIETLDQWLDLNA